jgi:uncharacterized Zn-finger protein
VSSYQSKCASITSSYRTDASNDKTKDSPILDVDSIGSLESGDGNIVSGGVGSKERRRRRRLRTQVPNADRGNDLKLFQCTFCTESFKAKYDWLRHEKSLHLSMEKWICAPLGTIIKDTKSGKSKCVYCDALEPSEEHLARHNHTACAEKSTESRTFYRKDHLRQHMRLR